MYITHLLLYTRHKKKATSTACRISQKNSSDIARLTEEYLNAFKASDVHDAYISRTVYTRIYLHQKLMEEHTANARREPEQSTLLPT